MQVGDYVRTREGIICKIVGGNCVDNFKIDIPFKIIEDSEGYSEHFLEYNDNGWYFNNKEHIIKSDPKLIKLVQVGDYVNGVLIEKIYERTNDYIRINTFDDEIMVEFKNENIKSIVTKEQFESMEYEVD